jgi:hypothetical protein
VIQYQIHSMNLQLPVMQHQSYSMNLQLPVIQYQIYSMNLQLPVMQYQSYSMNLQLLVMHYQIYSMIYECNINYIIEEYIYVNSHCFEFELRWIKWHLKKNFQHSIQIS